MAETQYAIDLENHAPIVCSIVKGFVSEAMDTKGFCILKSQAKYYAGPF